MPHLPRMKIQPTLFPDQRWLNRRFPDSPFRAPHGYVNSDDPLYIPEEQRVNISELQGPDLPSSITYNRESKWPDRDLARKLMREELARQAYNRKVAAWNEYIGMPTAERRFWTNRRKLEDAMMDYDLDLDQDPTWYTKSFETFEHLPTRPRPDYNAGMRRSLNPLDYPESVDFDTFPEDLIEAPWRQ